MTESLRDVATERFPTRPIAPLGIIAMRGTEEMGAVVNDYLMRWQQADDESELLHSFPGYENS